MPRLSGLLAIALLSLLQVSMLAGAPAFEPAPASVRAAPGLTAASPAPRPDPVQVSEPTRKADFQRLIGRVESLRGLRFVRPVPSYVQSRAEMRAYLERTLDAETDWAAENAVMKGFGFVPEGYDLRAGVLAFYTDQVAGYYDYRSRSFYMVEEGKQIAADDSMVVHEMDHALQDQHFDLKSLDQATQKLDQDDFTLAASALIEGDATLVMFASMFREMGTALEQAPPISVLVKGDMGRLAMAGGSEAFSEAPLYLRKLSLFPYLEGAAFVDHHRRRGGWGAVDALYLALPKSTEQILHPRKYGVDMPMTVKLGNEGPLVDGWARRAQNTMGEARIGILFEQFLPDHPERARWSDGWGGDTFRVYEDGTGRCLAWRTEWDDEAHADQFFTGIRLLLEEKHHIRLLKIRSGTWERWDGGRLYRVEKRSSAVLVMEGVPRGMASPLRRALGR